MALLVAPLGAADHTPVNWSTGPDHVGIWVDGVTTTNHPVGLAVDRSSGTNNVLTWSPPSFDDGRDLVGYFVYRAPSIPGDQPLVNVYVDGAETLSFTDPDADFDAIYIYFVTALFEDDAVSTESVASSPVIAKPILQTYPSCEPVAIDLGTAPYVFPNVSCLMP